MMNIANMLSMTSAVTVAAAIATGNAYSTPVEVSYESIRPTGSENFEDYPAGPLGDGIFRPIPLPPPSVQFQGFSIGPSGDSGLSGWIVPVINNLCLSKCLNDAREVVFPHAFNIDAGITSLGLSLWNSDYFAAFPEFKIEVVGNSGTLLVTRNMRRTEWLGFSDPAGLLSITFTNLGSRNGNGAAFTNYGFDDVIFTSAVPEPSSSCLTLIGLLVGPFVIRRMRTA